MPLSKMTGIELEILYTLHAMHGENDKLRSHCNPEICKSP